MRRCLCDKVLAIPATKIITATPDAICAGGATTLAVADAQAGVTYGWYVNDVKETETYSNISPANRQDGKIYTFVLIMSGIKWKNLKAPNFLCLIDTEV